MSLDWRKARIARNEASFRDINERLHTGLQQVRGATDTVGIVCECGNRECEETLELTVEEYESARKDSRRFVVVPGHIFPEAERVILESDRYHVLEKVGEAVVITDAADRRASGASGRRSSEPPA